MYQNCADIIELQVSNHAALLLHALSDVLSMEQPCQASARAHRVVLQALAHLLAVVGQHEAVADQVAEGRLVEQRGRQNHQRVEPAARLVLACTPHPGAVHSIAAVHNRLKWHCLHARATSDPLHVTLKLLQRHVHREEPESLQTAQTMTRPCRRIGNMHG